MFYAIGVSMIIGIALCVLTLWRARFVIEGERKPAEFYESMSQSNQNVNGVNES